MFSSLSVRKHSPLSGEDLQEQINQLPTDYMPMSLIDNYDKNKVAALNKLDSILKHTSRTALQERNYKHLLLCSLTLVYYFGMRIKLKTLKSCYIFGASSRRIFHRAEAAFRTTMDMLLPECNQTTIKITLNFFTDVSIWSVESFVEQVLGVLLFFDKGNTTLFNMMLTDIHFVMFTNAENETRHRMRVFYNLLLSPNWVIEYKKLLPFVTRLLDFFSLSTSKDDGRSATFAYIRKGFKVCLHRIFERVDNEHRMLIITTMLNWFSMVNLRQEIVLDFSTLLDHAAAFYKVRLYKDSFGEGLIEHVLVNLIGSTKATNSLVGCRLLLKFLDRQDNAQYLLVPTIFYDFTKIQLKIGEYDLKDKLFLRDHREMLNSYLMKAVKMHGTNIVNLKTIYSIVCCVVLEVPCGLSAAAAACMSMSVQDLALNGENIPAPCRNWMHAVVVSVMSLICWVHKAPLLYTYVHHIVARRAKEAPQLNPPMMYFYKIGMHHITWNKPTLFFEDWELRYALWKHFQDSQILLCLAALLAILVANTEGRNKKVVIHVPYKVKKIKHTHTVYKTIHHHHTHRDPHMDHSLAATEEHEHFHHMHIHDEPPVGQHSQPVPGIGIPEFLPDVPLAIPDVPPHEITGLPGRHIVPLYRRN